MGSICTAERPAAANVTVAWEDKDFLDAHQIEVDKFFTELDTDKNDKLTGDEITEMVEYLVKRFGDRGISKRTVQVIVSEMRVPDETSAEPEAAAEAAAETDAEKKLTLPEELTKIDVRKIFDKVVQKHLESMKAIAKIFNQIDERKLEDKDGNTKEEPLDNKLRAKFNQLDTDKSDKLDRGEIKKLLFFMHGDYDRVDIIHQQSKKEKAKQLQDQHQMSEEDAFRIAGENHQDTVDEQVDSIFEKYDKDHDQSLSWDEIQQWLKEKLMEYKQSQLLKEQRQKQKDVLNGPEECLVQ